MTGRARIVLAVLALLALLAVTYAPVRKGVFIWDDHALVETNALVERGSVVEIFRRPFLPAEAVGDTRVAYYRPLTVLSLRMDQGVAGGDAASFHVSNLLLHLAATIAFVCAARRLGAGALTSVIAAAWWALDPRSTESVAWISGRTDVLATLCALSAIALWPWYAAQDSPTTEAWRERVRAGGAGLSLLLALLAKEVALAAVLAIAVGTCLGAAGATWRERARSVAPRLAYVGVPLAIYAVLWFLATRDVTSRLTPLGAEARAATFLEAVGRYVEMTFDPWHPSTSIGLVGEIDRGRALFGAIVLAAGAAIVVRGVVRRRRSPPAEAPASLRVPLAVAAALALGSLAFVVHVLPIAIAAGVAADRLLYLPLAGVALGLAVAAGRLPRRAQQIAGVAVLILTATFVPVTRARAEDYTDELRFRVVAAETGHPRNTSAKSGLANTLRAQGEPELACRLHLAVGHALERTGRTGTPRHIRSLENLGGCFEMLGAYDQAAEVYTHILTIRPDGARVHMEIGFNHLHTFEISRADAAFRRALELEPNLVPAQQALAELPEIRVLASRLQTPEAQAADRVGWATLLTRVGRVPDATAAWLPIIEDRTTTDFVAWNGLEFLLVNADYRTARRAAEAFFLREANQGALAKQVLARRLARQTSIDALRPRIEALAAD
jgi:protein O-mannosyl-transferase